MTTRIDENVTRIFVRDWDEPTETETEIPDDDTREKLGPVIDAGAVMAEALVLALPDYPRHDEAALEQTEFTPPGADPIREEETKPCAALAALRDKLDGKG